MALLLKFGANFGKTMAADHGFSRITTNITPVIIPLHGVIHTMLSRVNGKGKRMCNDMNALA